MTTLHLISHTHWDREWYQPFQLFRLRLVRLIDGLLDLLDRDQEFKYFMLDGQTIVLEDYLAIRPENEGKMRKYVQNGRLIIGPWHILPDEFLVGPEAHIRNLLEGERACRRFGPKMRVGYIPDPFGHIGQMPQILKGFGIHVACVQRGLSDEPCEFWWEAPDGSRVFMAYLRESYGNAASLPTSNPEKFIAEVKRLRDMLLPHSASNHLLLMLGTDHMEPPPDTSQAIAAAKGKLNGDELIHSNLTNYISAVQGALAGRELPVRIGELRDCKRSHLLPGVLSTRMWIKQRNHACETLLTKWAEPFSAFASWSVEAFRGSNAPTFQPANVLREAWRLLMQCHPHDSICGCSIDQVHDEMKPRFDQVEQIGEEITRQSLEILAGAVQTDRRAQSADRQETAVRDPLSAVIVFNPLAFSRSDVVHFTLDLPPDAGGFDLVDEEGTSLPYQTFGMGGREIVNATFDAQGLQSAFGNISDGRAAGMVIQEISVRREDDQVFIDAVMADSGEPNLTAWNAARQQIEMYFADPTITAYHTRARSPSTVQVALSAPHIPGLGWRTFWVRPRPAGKTAPQRLSPFIRMLLPLARLPLVQNLARREPRTRPPYKIENDLFTVEAAQDGTLTLLDRRTGQSYRGLNRFVDGGDCGDEYNYAPPSTDRLAAPRLKRISICRGPVQQTLTLHLELKVPASLAPNRKSRSREMTVSRITSHITLSAGVPRVDIHTEVDNQARDHRLRVHFPAPFAAKSAHHDGHFEVVERKIGLPPFDETWIEQPRPEVPQRAFTDVSDGQYGLMIANRGLPEVEVLKNQNGNAEIALTLLRCIGWLSRDDFPTRKGHAGPMLETPGAQMQGRWEFDYSIIPHTGEWRSAFEQAYAFETPLRAVLTGLHEGNLPPSGSFVEVSPGEFVVSAIKETEDGRGWLARGYNLAGEQVAVRLKPWRRFKCAEKVNLAEEPIAEVAPHADGSLQFSASGHEILSFVLRD